MIKNLLSDDEPAREPEAKAEPPRTEPASYSDTVLTLIDQTREKPTEDFVISPSALQSADETMRQSGLAYSAGIAFFAAVVFMLILGWGADVLLGSSPWGIVGGILIGSIIGFVQFFRITSQIFKK